MSIKYYVLVTLVLTFGTCMMVEAADKPTFDAVCLIETIKAGEGDVTECNGANITENGSGWVIADDGAEVYKYKLSGSTLTLVHKTGNETQFSDTKTLTIHSDNQLTVQ